MRSKAELKGLFLVVLDPSQKPRLYYPLLWFFTESWGIGRCKLKMSIDLEVWCLKTVEPRSKHRVLESPECPSAPNPPNGRMHVPVYTTSVDFQPFLVYMYTRKRQKTALLVYTRQETDCAYWKKPYAVHRRGGRSSFRCSCARFCLKKRSFTAFMSFQSCPSLS